MAKYVKLHNLFCSFIKASAKSVSNDYEKKLINLVLDNFDAVANAGTAHGKRGQLLDTLIQSKGKAISSVLPDFEASESDAGYPFKSLSKIEIQHFRGFSDKEVIPFDKKYTFIYGPNGSGKSSFCEALEYSLLNYIDEAIARRMEVTQYIRNGFTGRGMRPKLYGLSHADQITPITPDPSLYDFVFIEKNRIDDFGRITANTPADKQDLLAALFGLGEFNDFVGNFTGSIENYIDVIGKLQQQLAKKSEGLQVQKDYLDKANKRLVLLEEDKKQISSSSGMGIPFDELKLFIVGSKEKEGRIAELNRLLTGPTPTKISVHSVSDIDNATNSLNDTAKGLKKLLADFESKRDEVKFRDLYSAAVALEEYSPDKCPVCETPVTKTSKPPFENAKNKLLELKEVAKLEADINQGIVSIRKGLTSLSEALKKRQEAAKSLSCTNETPTLSLTVIDGISSLPSLFSDLETFSSAWSSHHDHEVELDEMIEKHNKTAYQVINERSKLDVERTELTIISQKITEIEAKVSTELTNIRTWQKEIDDFQKENAELTKQADQEKATIDENKKFVSAYHSFVERLETYKNALPVKHLQHLNTLTLDIYNTMNADDRHYEKAARIVLPTSPQDFIRIAFEDNPDMEHDALHILSDGHIRCLGLAILLAKNIHDNCPLVVFDDIVNAIDDDHRGGIRNVIFKSDYLKSKQVILTTHAELFVNELEQHLTQKEYSNLVRKLAFFVDMQERLIRVKYDAQENYLVKIEKACTESQWKYALYNSRCCLENLSHKLWKRLGNRRYKTEFSVVIRQPNASPDLMSVVGSMTSFLKKIDKSGDFAGIIDIFTFFLGLESKNTIIWQYLNKGTHEEEGKIEFDQSIVKEISQNLVGLDKLIKAS